MMGRTHLAIGVLSAGVGGLFMNDGRITCSSYGVDGRVTSS